METKPYDFFKKLFGVLASGYDLGTGVNMAANDENGTFSFQNKPTLPRPGMLTTSTSRF